MLRKVAAAPTDIPDDATRLSYPDWIIERLIADLGRDDVYAALEPMNRAPRVRSATTATSRTWRPSGWPTSSRRSPASASLTCARRPAARPLALPRRVRWSSRRTCARAECGRWSRNVEALESHLLLVVADARHLPLRSGGFDRVLVDAPCSGLGVLRRRPDARWRMQPEDVARLATLQTELVDAAVQLVAPGGVLVYGVCTLTEAETLGVDEHLRAAHPELAPLDPPGPPWREHGRGALLLPQDADTDGMFVLRLRRGRHTRVCERIG